MVEQDLDGVAVVFELPEDLIGFLEELRSDGDVGNVGGIEVVQTVDEAHHLLLAGLDCGQDQEILEIPILRKLRVGLQHDLLEEIDQLVGQIGSHQGLHGRRDLLGGPRLGEGGLDNLIENDLPVLIGILQHLLPELGALSLDEVAGLQLEQGVLVGHPDELIIAQT